MNPRTIASFILLRRFVRSLPIALAIPPQSGEGESESGWRIGCDEGLAEFVQGHPVECPKRLSNMIRVRERVNGGPSGLCIRSSAYLPESSGWYCLMC